MKMFPIRTDIAEGIKQEYKKSLESMSLEELLKEFFGYLDYTEESGSGRIFHPVQISSCRAMATEPLDMVLRELRFKIAPIE